MSVGFGFGFDVSAVDVDAEELDCPAVSPFKNLASNALTSSFDCKTLKLKFLKRM